jgi:predicted TIM-barrel fold metal-dependent hydrolase
MGRIYANDAVRLTIKKIIHATGILDGHAHHNSGANCPIPLIYAQVKESAFDPSGKPWVQKRETLEWLISFQFKEGVLIQKMSTFDMGNHLAQLNLLTYKNITRSMDFADWFPKERKAGVQISTPLIIATMDMERAHIEGYSGQPIYHEEEGKLFFFRRKSGALPEREGKMIDLGHEIIVNKVDKSRTLKLQKWKRQSKDTSNVAVKNPLHMLPLYFYDPRRWNRESGTKMPHTMEFGAWDEIFKYIATDTFPGVWFGVKMYPPLGHKPLDEMCEYLPDFYHRCQKDKIPILTHCSPGGMTTHEAEFYREYDHHISSTREAKKAIQRKKLQASLAGTSLQPSNAEGAPVPWGESTDKKERFDQDYFFKRYVSPEAWRPVLENFPDLHICLAHFGGDEWRRGTLADWNDGPASDWINSTVDLTKKFKYCYTDISCFNLDNPLVGEDKNSGRTVRTTFNRMLHWMRDKDEYKHLRNKVIFGTDWYLTHLTRGDAGAEYGNYCREFKRMIDEVDPTFWIRFTLVNPWTCYSFTKEKLSNMKEALCDAGANKGNAKKALDKLWALDDEVARIKGQLEQWDK